MEYPGYGVYTEEGGCSDSKIKEDADYMYQYVKQETGLSDQDIMIFGRSIGTGPACHLAARHKVGLLALMSAYTSIRDIAKFQARLVGWMVKKHFDNEGNMNCV